MHDLLEILLRDCAAANPPPWYPADYVKQTGANRIQVDADLDRLRLAGLVRLTEWVQGKGQGYAPTPEGLQVLANPRLLQRLRQHGAEPQPVAPPLRPVESRPTTWDRGEAIRSTLMSPRRPVVTMLLIMANILVFLAGAAMARQENPDLLGQYFEGKGKIGAIHHRLGSLHRDDIIAGEWWRLLGYCFVHGSIIHIAMNMIALWMLGGFTETSFGPIGYLMLYLISGLGGGCAVAMYSEAGAVGASGCICGLLAGAGVWVFLNRGHLPAAGVARFFRGFMINVIILVFISTLPGVSAMGHVGGALAGGVVAIPLVFSRYGTGWRRLLAWAGVLAVPAACFEIVVLSITPGEQTRSVLLHMDRPIARIFNEYASHVLAGEDLGERKAKEAQHAFAEAIQAADQAERSLAKIHAAGEEGELKDARRYVASWKTLFELLEKAVARPATLTEQESHDLPRKAETLLQNRRDLLRP